MSARKIKIRPTYRQHSDDTVHADIRARLMQGTPFWDYLSEIRQDDIDGRTDREAWIAEGMRRLARNLQEISLGVYVVKEG